jgi:hypothetical protein
MARLVVEGDDLVVRLSVPEKFWAFHGDVRVPLAGVRRVTVPDYPFLSLRGWRMAGLNFPGLAVLGTRRHADGFDFVAIRRRQLRAIQVDLNGPPRWQRLVVSVPEAVDVDDTAHQIAAAAGIGPG